VLSRFFDRFSGSLPATQLLVIVLMSPFKGQTGLKRILNASGYSMAGLRAAFTGEAAFRQLVLLNVVLIPLSFFFSVSRVERALMIAVCLLALIVELLNSAIEAAIDRISLDLHPLSKNAKDMGSAAQFVALSLIASVWAVILL
jgi:diacylglycerol kinase (ATP)